MNSRELPSLMELLTETVWHFYDQHKRSMPWRSHPTPYNVVVSEIMLQQTQVDRVTPKFESFTQRFPSWNALAKASIENVLKEWSGLGYNRRALYLKRIAEIITDGGTTEGILPDTYDKLIKLPGIGPNTAGSILAFGFNKPHPFIETNIRTVYIHHFFKDNTSKVHDKEIMDLIQKTLHEKRVATHPREWYWALMDYGSYLKHTLPNPSRKSKHHVKQKPFKGSNRELRSKILQTILSKRQTLDSIQANLHSYSRVNVERNIEDLIREGFITKSGLYYEVRSS